MRKLFAVLLAGVFCTMCFAQDYEVVGNSLVFTKVIENTGKTVPEAHDALVAFFATRYGDSNSTQKLDKPDHLIYKGVFANVNTHMMGALFEDLSHTLDVSIKENRLRVRVSVDEVICRGTQYLGKASCPATDCLPENKSDMLLRKTAANILEAMQARVRALFADIEVSLNKSTTDEDW